MPYESETQNAIIIYEYKDYWPPDKLKRKYFIEMSNVYSSELLPFYNHLQ